MFSLKGKLTFYVFSLLIILFLNACNSSADKVGPGTYSVDPTFSDFYKEFGGDSVLGPAISPSFVSKGITYQYVVSGLMAYDPSQLALARFHFTPIASAEWGINDLVEPVPSNPDLAFVNGHLIWEEVLSFYDRYGPEIIGLPVTGVNANDEKQRYEQYFEGLGFFRDYSAQYGQIQLMPYGSWMCGGNCQYKVVDVGPPPPSYSRDYSETEQLFLQESERLGYNFTGTPLAPPYIAADTNFEMVFENVAMFIYPVDGYQIKLRPLPSWLGIQTEQPTQETEADWLSFYPLSEDLGYNVPNTFVRYIEDHGGMIYSGNPITEYRYLPDGGYSQCFTKLCLEYHPTAPQQLLIRPHELGKEYQTNGYTPVIANPSTAEALQINVWEEFPLIPSGQAQIINIEASQNDTPMIGVEFSLIVKQPDGITKSYKLNPTGEGGATSIELDPINGPNGSIVQYEVCLLGIVTPQVCFTRSYTIWNQ
jgi:hypothetical protein